MFKDVREDADEGSLDEARSILQIDIGESYLAQCHNIKNDGWRPLNVWMWYTANNDYEVHMVKFSNITATDDSSVPAPDVISYLHWRLLVNFGQSPLINLNNLYQVWRKYKLSPQTCGFKLFHVGVRSFTLVLVDESDVSSGNSHCLKIF